MRKTPRATWTTISSARNAWPSSTSASERGQWRERDGTSGTKKYTTHKIWNTLRLLSRSKWQRRRQRSQKKYLHIYCVPTATHYFFLCAAARSRNNIFLIYAQPQKKYLHPFWYASVFVCMYLYTCRNVK